MKKTLVLIAALALSGCSVLNFPDNLSRSILNHDDPELVRDAVPAYLIMLDALVAGDPRDEDFLLAASRLYGAYAGAFVHQDERARKHARRASDYAERALCESHETLCAALDKRLADVEAALAALDDRDDLPSLYGYATARATWIQTHSGDWNAVAELPKVTAALRHVVALQEDYDGGMAHVYLGVLDTQLPPAMGGKPERARKHFERAIDLSDGKNLMAKVYYARQYARMVFDRELHDRLLAEVLEADTRAEGLTLVNTLAQKQAQALQASANDYF